MSNVFHRIWWSPPLDCFRRYIAVFKREMGAYFYSPTAYIVTAIFVLVTGIFFFFISSYFSGATASLNGFFQLMPFTLSFTMSALTMRLYSEEHAAGSIEILKTLPVRPLEALLGKFAAVVTLLQIMVFFTAGYPVSIYLIGDLDIGEIMAGYNGIMLLGAAYAAIGIWASAVSGNQIVAFFISFAITMLMAFLYMMVRGVPGEFINFLQYLSSSYHFQRIGRGVMDIRDVLYFVSVAAVALLGALVATGKERRA